ncbi:MAG: nuclear transport factor 2 family protein [Pyrinomonadaceae bacterium]
MNLRSLTFSLILAVVCFSSAFGQTPSKDETALKSLLKQMTDAQTAYDSAALDRIFASDYIEISPAGEFDPREKVLGFYTPKAKAEAGNTSASLEIGDYSVRQYDKFAIVIARFSYTITADGKTMPPRSMRATVVFRKEKSEWKIASTQYTGIRPPAPPKPQ